VPTMRTRHLGVLLAGAALLLTSCGGDDDAADSSDGADSDVTEAVSLMDEAGPEDETGAEEVTVDAVDNNFKPKYIEVSVGTEVTFVNDGQNVHNVLPVEDGAFEPIEASGFDPGEENSVFFDEAGDFPYYCSLHGTTTKGMIGGIRVVE
jgi:plastocyanin